MTIRHSGEKKHQDALLDQLINEFLQVKVHLCKKSIKMMLQLILEAKKNLSDIRKEFGSNDHHLVV